MQYRMLLVLLFTLFQPMAHAVDFEPSQITWQLAARQGQLSLSDAADLVQRSTGGRVLSAQAVREQGREMYRIKVLTPQGEVRIVLVDPATGRME
jgi:uncharacterized membrane protein YkoI